MSLTTVRALVAALAAGVAALTLLAGLEAPAAGSREHGPRVPGGGELEGLVVTIDPGHNGGNGSHPSVINQQVPIGGGETKECDTTGTETASGYSEHAYTFSVAKKLERLLEDAGAKVVLTRSNDHGVGPCIDERAEIGNEAGSDVAVSIHADGGPPGGRGYHVIYPARIQGLTDDIYSDSRRLAVLLRNAYGKVTGLPRSTYVGDSGLDRRSDLGGLRLSDVPKVFIETGNMRNHTDAGKLESKRFRGRVAKGIFAGLRRFLLG